MKPFTGIAGHRCPGDYKEPSGQAQIVSAFSREGGGRKGEGGPRSLSRVEGRQTVSHPADIFRHRLDDAGDGDIRRAPDVRRGQDVVPENVRRVRNGLAPLYAR